jgi:E1A/CREB-binding protein
MQELRNKREDAKDPKSKPKGSSSAAHGDPLGEETKDDLLLNQITEEMRSMRNHFIVVTLLELKKGQQRAVIHDPVPLISNEFVDTRSAFLERCQMYHWQFDELRNAQHSTLMLLYHLHGMHRAAKAKLALQAVEKVQPKEGVGGVPAGASRSPGGIATSRSSKIETAMHDWSTLLAHANQAATSVGGLPPTWALPPDDLFQRILAQINRSKRDILQEKYNACLSPTCSAQARSVFIRVLKRIAESFMTCLLQMQMQVGAGDPNAQPRPSVPQPAQANGWGRA